jgi:membrane fusion protein, macrolide-specific efflux system
MAKFSPKAFWFSLCAIALIAFFFWKGTRSSPGSKFETVELTKGDIVSSVTAIGTLQPVQSVEVGAQVSGQILRLHVQAGDVVEKNQLLAEIDSSVLQATVDAGRAALDNLHAQVSEQKSEAKLAALKLERQRRLYQGDITSKELLESAETALEVANAKIRQLEAQIVERESTQKGDEALLGFARIYAPVSGTVISVEAKEGQTLNATYQTPTILRIADLSKMTVWTDVAEADIQRVKEGMTASFTTLGNQNKHWQGVVRQILHMPPPSDSLQAPAPEFGKVINYTVLFDVDNADHALLPRMTTQVTILTDSAKDVLVAPLAGLIPIKNQGNRWHARVLDATGKDQLREITIGRLDRKAAEVLDGLAEGEQLIVGEVPDTQPKRFIW